MCFFQPIINMDQCRFLYEFSSLLDRIDLELGGEFIGLGLWFRRLSLDRCLWSIIRLGCLGIGWIIRRIMFLVWVFWVLVRFFIWLDLFRNFFWIFLKFFWLDLNSFYDTLASKSSNNFYKILILVSFLVEGWDWKVFCL